MAQVIDYGRFAARLRQARERAAADPGRRWALLDQVQREWGYTDPGGDPVWRPGDGENTDEGVDPSLPVPAALTEWWDTPVNSFAHRPRLYWVHTQWPPATTEDGRMCVFLSEYQYCNEWAYPVAEAGRDDPRVLVRTDRDTWEPQAASLSEFLLHLALERLPAHFGFTAVLDHEDLEADPAVLDRLRAAYPGMGLLPWHELGSDAVLYGGPDVVIRHGRGHGADWPLMVYGRTRRAVTAALAVLAPGGEHAVAPPEEEPDRLLDLPPVAFHGGEEDAWERWTVRSVGEPPPGRPDPGPDVVSGAAPLWPAGTHRAPVTAVTRLRTGPQAADALVVSGDAAGVLRIGPAGGPPAPRPLDRRGTPVTALASAVLPGHGPVVAAAWADGLVRLWDLETGCTDVAADLRLGTGIGELRLTGDARLWVRGPHGWAELRLDPVELWVLRQVRERADRFPWDRLRCNPGWAHEVPGQILRAGWDDEAVAAGAARRLEELLVHGHGATAAQAAAPLLAMLVVNGWTPDRGRLLRLLAALARVRPGHSEAADAQRDILGRLLPTLRLLADHPDEAVRAGLAELERACAA
ncbi:hypothetical protein [Streptomyces xiamenensis]|uniref:hypothetical protein n=1 Tax=Streptomyces xiamenensis TaxID=408015 RepID=UPI0037D97ED8